MCRSTDLGLNSYCLSQLPSTVGSVRAQNGDHKGSFRKGIVEVVHEEHPYPLFLQLVLPIQLDELPS